MLTFSTNPSSTPLTWAIVVGRAGNELRRPTPHEARLMLRHSENGEESE
jgi:hypothetical protein